MSRFVRDPRFALAACMLLLGAAIAFPLGVIASHQFSDVPNTNTYHADIDAVADAGVTTGCGNGTTYCPSAYVTREQMAAFMNRLGALQAGKTPVVNATKLDGLNSTQFARTDVALSGTAECSAQAATPTGSGFSWGLGYGTNATSSADATFRCVVDLPDGATVTEVRWRVRDSSATANVSCQFIEGTWNAFNFVATVVTTNAAVPGLTTLTDSTITGGLVNQSAYDYSSSCTLTAPDANTSFFGVAVDYTVPGLVMP